MELLGYHNFEIHPSYDENNFLKIEDPDTYSKIIFHNLIEGESLLDTSIDHDYLLLSVNLNKKTESYYSYHIYIVECWGTHENVALGDVDIYYNQTGIEKILVNGVENAFLEDRYKDSFDISHYRYLHILYNQKK